MTVHWGEKRYYSLDYYLKKTYGEKLYKISLDGGMTCPNRDGTLGTHGCIFCSRGGSGDFAASRILTSVLLVFLSDMHRVPAHVPQDSFSQKSRSSYLQLYMPEDFRRK